MKNTKNPTQAQRTAFQYAPEQNPGENHQTNTKQNKQANKSGNMEGIHPNTQQLFFLKK